MFVFIKKIFLTELAFLSNLASTATLSCISMNIFFLFFFYLFISCLFLQNNKTIHKLKAYKKSI